MSKHTFSAAEIVTRAVEFAEAVKHADDSILDKLDQFTELARDERFKTAVRVAWQIGGRTPSTNGAGMMAEPAAKSPRIRWKTPKGKDRKRPDKAWHATAGDLDLRVERSITRHSGVVFRAFIGDECVGQDKLMSNAQSIAADEAIRRIHNRA